jgi:hypothetical protein
MLCYIWNWVLILHYYALFLFIPYSHNISSGLDRYNKFYPKYNL